MSYIPLIEDLDVKLNLINTIKDVSEKKIYLEVEYARCILLLVKFKENDNEIADAASIL
jgi:26S proteasome regulatory subunit N5